MLSVFSALRAYIVSHFRSHDSLRLENMALRHQLAVYQQTVKRPKLHPSDRLFWSWLSCLWPGWQQALEFVQPRTVITWQKKRFRDYWRHLSQGGTPGRPAPLPKKSATSSKICGAQIPCGDHLVSWVNSVSWVSTWPNQPWSNIDQRVISRHRPRGRPSSTITSRTSWRVISSPCRRPAARSCSCLSSWLTSAGALCVSISPNTQRRNGPPNRSSKRFPGSQRPVTC
jgi:hypothetical protein